MSTVPALHEAASLIAELEEAKRAFHGVAEALSEDSWKGRSANPGWTNGQVLFHITLAFMLLPYLVRLGRFFGSLPPGWSKVFAAILDAGAPVFHWVNGRGPSAAGAVYPRERLLRKYDALHAYAVTTLARLESRHLERGMYYPGKWDPLFRGFLTLADVFHYPIVHMHHHLEQIVA